jgi:PPOX class probable F420-dependent enzyme
MAELPHNVRALFQRANFAHVATVLPDGAPHSVPVWATLEDGRIAFFTQPGSRKARNLEADPRVAISIVDHQDPYKTAQVRGRVVETVTGDAALAIMDRMSLRYTGKPFPYRAGIALLVEPEKASFTELAFEHTPTVESPGRRAPAMSETPGNSSPAAVR